MIVFFLVLCNCVLDCLAVHPDRLAVGIFAVLADIVSRLWCGCSTSVVLLMVAAIILEFGNTGERMADIVFNISDKAANSSSTATFEYSDGRYRFASGDKRMSDCSFE